jgi:hypothetical protein
MSQTIIAAVAGKPNLLLGAFDIGNLSATAPTSSS